jgi:hypothetical protein
MKKIEFDEFQQSRRYQYGYQSFILLLFLLLIDNVVSGISTVWSQYPSHSFILVLVGCTYFISRCVWGDALVGPKETPKKVTGKIAAIVLGAVVVAVAAGFVLVRVSIDKSQVHSGGSEIFSYCLIMWAVIGIVYAVKRACGHRTED